MIFTLSFLPDFWRALFLSVLMASVIFSIVFIIVQDRFLLHKVLVVISILIYLWGLVYFLFFSPGIKLTPTDLLLYCLGCIGGFYVIGYFAWRWYILKKNNLS